MGRPRNFDEQDVIVRAATLFGAKGYDAVAVDVLVAELGINRASLYKIFGSKHGLLLASLQAALDGVVDQRTAQDLALVCLLELAPHDETIRKLCHTAVAMHFQDTTDVGTRLLSRAQL